MKKISEIDLANALKTIENSLLDGKILPKEYDGYASSFGPSVINSGLLPALSFYSDVHKNPNQVRRFKLIKVIFKVAYPDNFNADKNGLLEYVLQNVFANYQQNALAGQLGELNTIEHAKMKMRIMEASVAVKLAMRNFKHSDSENKS